MEIASVLLAGLLGAILGSFINALSFRYNTGRGMSGRSRCMHCGHTLAVQDLIPLFSFAFLRGRCRYCKAKISFQYPLVELVAAVLAVLVYQSHFTSVETALWFLVAMTLLFIVVYDIRHGIIPWSASAVLAVLALSHLVLMDGITLWGVLAGPLLALPLFLLSLVSRGTWMGWGDSVLEISLGWLLGLSIGATALMLAFWSGAAVGIVLVVLKKGFRMNSELPFAPFLVFGALAAHFLHVDFFAPLALLFS